MPSDVAFIKSPATWNDMLKTHATIYYTAKALGIEQQFVPAAFNTIQNEGKMLTGNTELEYYFRGFDVQKDRYKAVSTSFGVRNAVDQADKKMKEWKVTGVPSLVVNGKYKVAVLVAGLLTNDPIIWNLVISEKLKQDFILGRVVFIS